MRAGAYSAAEREAALLKAEQDRMPATATTVELKPNQIKAMHALFQPREFSYGLHDLDPAHVNELAKVIAINGTVDPVLVIRIKRTGWVIVDGHHSIAAYEKLGRGGQELTCGWFQGTVREAMDESLARNIKIKLNLPKHDKYEEAWKRTLLDHGSKRDTVKRCVVSEGTVAFMRRVKREAMGAAADLEPENTKRCRDLLRIRATATAEEALEVLKQRSWSMTRLAFAGIDDGERMSEKQQVANLTDRLRSRFANRRLSADPVVTAKALRAYDAYLPERLTEAWARIEEEEKRIEAVMSDPTPDSAEL